MLGLVHETVGGKNSEQTGAAHPVIDLPFFGLDIGRASAMSVALLILILVLTTYLYRYMRSFK